MRLLGNLNDLSDSDRTESELAGMPDRNNATSLRPPGPRDGLFGLRTLARMQTDLLGSRTELKRVYGDSVSLALGPYRLYVFFHPDQVREVLVKNASSLIRLPRVTRTFSQWNGSSVLVAEGEAWIRQRRLLQTAFQPGRLRDYAQVAVASARALVDSWKETIDNRGQIDVNIDDAMTKLALSVICRTMFSSQIAEESSDVAKAVSILSDVAFREMQSLFTIPLWLPTPKNRCKRWAIGVLEDVVRGFILERRSGHCHSSGPDLLSILMSAEQSETGSSPLSDRQICDEAKTLMLTGHETTATALDWLWYNIARCPDVARRCQEEIDTVVGSRLPAAEDAGKLNYLVATIKESLRLYPPVVGVFPRQTIKDIEIAGFVVPKRSLIALSSFVTQRDPRWFPDPERFDPQRFLSPQIDNMRNGAWFPFGAGPRACIGQAFAMTELVMIATSMLQLCSVTTIPGAAEPDWEVKMTLRPKGPLLLRWSWRTPSREKLV